LQNLSITHFGAIQESLSSTIKFLHKVLLHTNHSTSSGDHNLEFG